MFQTKAIVEAHGGTVQVESALGKGSTFRVALPITPRAAMKQKLLIVDDDEAIRTQMKWALSNDYEIALAEDRISALSIFRTERPAVTLLDLGLPPHPNDPDEGLATLAEILAADPQAKVIVISGQGDKQNALEAVGAGAYDFLCKPVDMDELTLILRRCMHVAELEREYREMQQAGRADVFEDMLGTSPQMQGVFSFIRKVATTTAPVLILGESGTGKEMAAWPFTAGASEAKALSSRSTAARFPKICSRANSSATRKVPSRERTCSAKGSSKPPPAARCSSTKSASCRLPSR